MTPLSLLTADSAEELSFSRIYCGHKRQISIKSTYNDIVKSDLRRFDRRCCNVTKVFYMFRKKETLALKNAINIHLRITTTTQDLRAGAALIIDNIEQLLNSDEAYKVLVQDRSSPPYWQARMKDLFAMIRGYRGIACSIRSPANRYINLSLMLARTKIRSQQVHLSGR